MSGKQGKEALDNVRRSETTDPAQSTKFVPVDASGHFDPEQQPAEDPKDRKAYVPEYGNHIAFPLEIGEIVWIMKPGFRAPLGVWRIVKAHPDNKFELVNHYDNTAYPELVEGRYLMRDE